MTQDSPVLTGGSKIRSYWWEMVFWEEERYPGEKELPKPYPDRLSELQRLIYTKKKKKLRELESSQKEAQLQSPFRARDHSLLSLSLRTRPEPTSRHQTPAKIWRWGEPCALGATKSQILGEIPNFG